jgi:putative oxidoreductase
MIRTFLATLQRFDRNETLVPYGVFLLRMTLVAIWIAHFWYKVGYRGMPATETFFVSLGYPTWFAWADVCAEFVAILMLAGGLYVRILSLLLLVILIPATAVWIPKGFYFVNAGYEFMLTWCVLQVVQAALGPGAFSLETRGPFAISGPTVRGERLSPG